MASDACDVESTDRERVRIDASCSVSLLGETDARIVDFCSAVVPEVLIGSSDRVKEYPVSQEEIDIVMGKVVRTNKDMTLEQLTMNILFRWYAYGKQKPTNQQTVFVVQH